VQIYFSRTLLCLGYADRATVGETNLWQRRAHTRALWGSCLPIVVFANGVSNRKFCRAEEVVALAIERAFLVWLASGTTFRGWSLTTRGRQFEGIALLHQGLTVWRVVGIMMDLPMYLMLLADAYGNADQPPAWPHAP